MHQVKIVFIDLRYNDDLKPLLKSFSDFRISTSPLLVPGKLRNSWMSDQSWICLRSSVFINDHGWHSSCFTHPRTLSLCLQLFLSLHIFRVRRDSLCRGSAKPLPRSTVKDDDKMQNALTLEGKPKRWEHG